MYPNDNNLSLPRCNKICDSNFSRTWNKIDWDAKNTL